MHKKFPESNPRDFALANHVRAAAWARESRNRALGSSTSPQREKSRWAAQVAREWWTRFLAS